MTSPEDETVATPVSDDDQSTVNSAIEFPPASVAVAVRVSVSPMTPNVSESRESSRVTATWVTVTAAVALAAPEVAVIVAEPLATAVTSPSVDTLATVVSDEVQVRIGPEILCPPASFASAVSRVVSPSEVKLRTVSDNSTLIAA